MAIATTRRPGVLFPDALYSRRAFMVASGISEERLRLAKKDFHLEPRRFWIGKRCWIRGADAITFMELLAAEEIRRDTTYTTED